jgi:hypothetical protein
VIQFRIVFTLPILDVQHDTTLGVLLSIVNTMRGFPRYATVVIIELHHIDDDHVIEARIPALAPVIEESLFPALSQERDGRGSLVGVGDHGL